MLSDNQTCNAMQDLLKAASTEWQSLLHAEPHGCEVLIAVLESYGEPGRHYHTLEHIAEMTLLLAEYRDSMSGTADAYLACLYHDIIYDAQRADNEEKSVEVWRTHAEKMQVRSDQIERVSELILATRKHQPTNDSIEMLLFLDTDLAILGAARKRYEAYIHGVRYEYAHVPETEYRPGRTAVLQKFLARPQLYFTAQMRERFEAAARRNMDIEIKTLGRTDTFCGTYDFNASNLLTYSINDARAAIYEAINPHLEKHFGFNIFSEPIWGHDQVIGECSNGKVTLKWGHDFYSGFHFFASEKSGDETVREIGDYINSIISGTEFNIYRQYMLMEF